jgi:hypothetical protein
LKSESRRLLAILTAALTFIATACRDIDVVTQAYATLAEATADGAVDRGYLPRGLPSGTRDIREAHDQKSSRRWGLFNFPQTEAEVLRALIGPEVSLRDMRIDPPRRIEWWPVLLRGAVNDEQVAATGTRVYAARQGDLIFAINWSQGRAYYWTKQ